MGKRRSVLPGFLLYDTVYYLSVEQLSDLLRFSYEVKEENGICQIIIEFNGQSIVLPEKDKKAIINGTPFMLSGESFTFSKSSCRFWLPLKDWAKIVGEEVLRVEHRSFPFILLF